jgi:hypothetical protein
MVYIGTTENNGSAIYFDVHFAERRGRGLSISGTIGDGCYEGEVLVEIGRSDSVTFADAWLGGSGFAEFISRCGVDVLERALLETLREMPLFHKRSGRPHGNSPAYAGAMTCERPPRWGCGA